MSKLKGLLLTEGMHGMISQVEGLAKALGIDYIHQKVEINLFAKLLPPKITPISNLFFKKFIVPEIDLIISCGRKSVIPSLYLKKNSSKKIVNIHIQDPKVSLSNFDYVIVPEHDGLNGTNVISSKGALHYITLKEIEKNHNYLGDKINKNKQQILLILGGPNKYYKYDKKNLRRIFENIKELAGKNNLQIIIIPSMRTPADAIDYANKFFGNENVVIQNVDKKAYLSGLSIAKFLVVTCDSTSMISEAALTGKPIYVAQIPPKKDDLRFRQFRDLFSKLNIIKSLDRSLEIWKYEKLDETNRIANIIKLKL
ncbi:mitochondrial fission ELM1 family protein [Candidatus Pelagibacter sp.]|nr:mitochondrial fission ELM1 family protein [Candidatus Pelagibacter sp.]